MPYDKRYKRFKEFTEDAKKKAPCKVCNGTGLSGGVYDYYGNEGTERECPRCHGTGLSEEMSAGGGAVAGIGQPPGSKFGEHPQQAFALGGATTKTKKKNKKAHFEGFGDWAQGKTLSDRDAKAVLANAKAALSVWPEKDLPALKRLIADAERGSSGVIRLRQFLRDNGVVYEWDQTPSPIEGGEKLAEVTDDEVEAAAKQVHDTWVANQKKDGKSEHKSPDGKEDYMVPYEKLKEKSKDMDRDAVKATVDALGLDETKNAHKDDELEDCMACDGRGIDWGETCVTCGGAGKYWISKKTGRFSDYYHGLDEERETFAGSPVFEVDTDKWMKSRFGKNRYHRYSRYVGEDDAGEEIRQHGRSKRKDDIILKDQTTGAMTYFLRRKKAGK